MQLLDGIIYKVIQECQYGANKKGANGSLFISSRNVVTFAVHLNGAAVYDGLSLCAGA